MFDFPWLREMRLRPRVYSLDSVYRDQVHIVKQGVIGLHLDSTSHKLKRPKKFTCRWSVLTRCEKTGQHTLHICKTDSPDSSVKESYPVQTSWSIKSAHCLKSSQRMDIFKEEGFIIHMGRQVAYVSCTSRSEVKGWMCAILEAVTLGFEYHCRCGGNRALGVTGECMLVLSPECIALLCPLTGAPLRKWPYFLLTSCAVVDDTLHWTTHDCDAPYKATVNKHNVFTLYNVLCRYLSHTNPNVQVDITISKSHSIKSPSSPAENKYTERGHTTTATQLSSSPPGLCANQLYQSQEACFEKINYEMLSSNHSDYSTGISSAGSTYDSDIYEYMENSEVQGLTTDSIYEDMSSCSPRTDEGYMTSSTGCLTSSAGNVTSRPRLSSRHGRSTLNPTLNPTLYINMDKPSDQNSALLSRDEEARPANYEYIDIEIQDPRQGPRHPSQPAPPQLPFRNKNTPDKSPAKGSASRVTSRDGSRETVPTIPRDRLNVGLKSYQEQVRLEKEMLVNFSAAVLDSNSSEVLSTSQSRTFMNSAV